MEHKNMLKLLAVISFIVFIKSTVASVGNSTKSTVQKSSSCYDCTMDNTVCVDGDCYCEPNYKKQQDTLNSWSCVDDPCFNDIDCYGIHDPYRQCSSEGKCYCKPGYHEDIYNGRKCTLLSGGWGCSNCYSSDNKVCVDGQCYCEADYKNNPSVSGLDGKCLFEGCSIDSDCEKSHDWFRQCSYGSCVCDTNYYEDLDNGKKCTYSYPVSVWSWAWAFFLVPGLAAAIFLCIRRRKMHMVQTQQVQYPPPPPPYLSPQQQQPLPYGVPPPPYRGLPHQAPPPPYESQQVSASNRF